MTQMLAKPASSAVLAIRANPGPIEPGAPGQVKLGTCNPTRTPVPSIPQVSVPTQPNHDNPPGGEAGIPVV